MKLKELKGAPLLSPPSASQFGWMSLREDDVKIIADSLAKLEKRIDSFTLTSILRYFSSAKRLGVDVEMTPSLAATLKLSFAASAAGHIPEDRYLMTELGLDDGKFRTEDLQMIRRSMVSNRKAVPKGPGFAGAGPKLASTHHYMNELGMPQEMTEEDRRLMLSGYIDFPWPIGDKLFYCRDLKALGLEANLTPQEIDEVRRDVERLRRKKDGAELALVLQLAHDTIQPPPEQDGQKGTMPPLKRYRG